MTLEGALKFYIDKGSAYKLVVKEVMDRGFPEEEVRAAIDSLVEDGTFARGPAIGGKDMLVVLAWSPRTAAKMDEME